MRRLSVFNSVSLDGYFRSLDGDVGWTHGGKPDPEFDAFIAGNASGGGGLVFGRKTYEMMAQFWPSPMAAAEFPVVARQMNALPKLVFSRTLAAATWQNTTLVDGDVVTEMRRMKKEQGPDLAILGSGSLVAALARAGLVDEFQLLVQPVVLGAGKTMFDGVGEPLRLALTSTRRFANGNLFNVYEPRP